MELKETFMLYQFMKGYDKESDEHQDKEIAGVRSGRVPNEGASVPMEMGYITVPV